MTTPARAVTVDPSALQAARLALATLTLTWPMLAAAADTTLTRRTVVSSVRYEPDDRCHDHADDDDPPDCRACRNAQRRHLSWVEVVERRDAQLRAEREDRDATERYRALPSTRPPADLDVIDVRTFVLQVLHTSLLLARSDLRQRPHPPAPNRVTPNTIGWATSWLANALDRAAGATPAAIAAELQPAGRHVHDVLGLDPDELWKPMGTARCPVCKQRALYRWNASPDRRAWTRECRNPACQCTGPTCPCARPGAQPRSRHLWPA